METIGSRFVLLLLLVTVAAAAILAGRGTDPADEIRLAGKAENLLGDGGSAEPKGPSDATGSHSQAAATKAADVAEPPLSYADFIARSEGTNGGGDKRGDARAGDEVAEAASARPTVASPAHRSPDAAPTANPKPSGGVALTAPSGDAMRAHREPDPAGEPASRANAGGPERESHVEGASDRGATRVADAGASPENGSPSRNARTISEPSGSEPSQNDGSTSTEVSPNAEFSPSDRSTQSFKPGEASSDAASDWSMPVNPYEENPYVPRQAAPAAEEPPAETRAPQGQQGAGQQENGQQRTSYPGTSYPGTATQQGVRWERYLPTSEPITEPSRAAPEAPAARPRPSSDGGLQPPANRQPANRELAGPAPTGMEAYPGPARAPAGMTMPSPQPAPSGNPAGNPYAVPQGNVYGNTYGNVYGNTYGNTYGNAAGPTSEGMPTGGPHGAPAMPSRQGGSYPAYDPSVPQQAVSPYDAPRR